MENTSLSSGSEVYILMRVFNLGQGDKIDMRLYVDPYSAKVRGDLTFTASNWLVNPNFSRVFQSASESIKSSPATLANVKSSETPLSQADVASVVVSVGGGSSWPSGSKLGDYKSPSTAEVPYTLTTARGLDTCPTEENHFHSISHMAHYIKWSFEVRKSSLLNDLTDWTIGITTCRLFYRIAANNGAIQYYIEYIWSCFKLNKAYVWIS